MLSNRSIPTATVIPVLAYVDVNEAAAWLCNAFGFEIRLRVDNHRIQLNIGNGAIILREPRPHENDRRPGLGHSIHVRIEDADAHCIRAKQHGAIVIQEPTTFPYGERQYVTKDFAGYEWTFSQSVADKHPSEWGGTAVNL